MKEQKAGKQISKLNNYPSYPGYKDSGVGWLGEIPEHWDIERLKYCCVINPKVSGINSEKEKMKVTFLSMEMIGEDGSLDLSQSKQFQELASGYTNFRDGDILIAKITPCFENGKGALAQGLKNGIGFGTTELHVLRPKRVISNQLLFYITKSHIFREFGKGMMKGTAGQKRVPTDFLENFRIGIPPLPEQKVITKFLDREPQKIDKLIEKKERLIELLEEKRQAIVTKAVTKGLDPNVPMKDSGIDWLGEIPEHWEIVCLKLVTDIENGYGFNSDDYIEDGILLMRIGDLANSNDERSDTKYLPLDFAKRFDEYLVYPGDILIALSGATTGKSHTFQHNDPALLNQRVARLRATEIEQSYLQFSIKSSYFKEKVKVLCYGGAQDNISSKELGNIKIALPPSNSQDIIGGFLKQETERIDKLISKIEEAINKLKEYRTALISAAVTGKIDVRDEVNLPTEKVKREVQVSSSETTLFSDAGEK